MARYKKTILSFFIILLILLGIKHIVLAADTGKANEDAKLRKSMDDTSIILEIIPKNDEFEILEEYDDWYKVNYMKIKGYVKKLQVEIIKKEDSNDSNTTNEIESQNTNDIQTNEVNSSIIENNDEQEEIKVNDKLYVKSEINLFLRPLPNSMKIQTLKKNQEVTVKDITNKWVYIEVEGRIGWVRKEMLTTTKPEVVSEKKKTVTSRSATNRSDNTITKASSSDTTKQNQIVSIVKKYLGCKYVYGGSSPSGFDCSGLTMYVYKQLGISLPHSASAQSTKGTQVAKENLQPGDIVFFTNYKTNTGIGHCGIYIGDNKFIHASTEKTGVITSSLTSSGYQKRYVTAVRFF